MAVNNPLNQEEVQLLRDNRDHVLLKVLIKHLENEYIVRAAMVVQAKNHEEMARTVGEMAGIHRCIQSIKVVCRDPALEMAMGSSQNKRPSAT